LNCLRRRRFALACVCVGEVAVTDIDRHDDEGYRHPWLGVEVRHLATLSAVARIGSFRQAARELGYVQSAVSQQIARLEQVVGARLVERHRGQRNVRLTRVGEVLAERGERILGELQAARIDLSVMGEEANRTISLAVAGDHAPLIGRLLSTMCRELRGTCVQVTEVASDAELVRLLESGAADAAIGGPLAAPGVGSVVLLQDPYVVLAAPESRVAGLTFVSSPAELADERLIVPTSLLVQGPLHAPGLLLERALEVPFAATVPVLVAQGHGIGLVPSSAVAHTLGRVATVPTAGLIAPQRVMLGWHAARRRTTRVKAFCDAAVRAFLQEEFADRAA
jgi:molybdate transport repressor ModE-like protein